VAALRGLRGRAQARAGRKNLMFSGTKLGLKELEDYKVGHSLRQTLP
jgi:hypothetical protein